LSEAGVDEDNTREDVCDSMVMTVMELTASFTTPQPCSQVLLNAARARHPALTQSPAPSRHGVFVVAGDGLWLGKIMSKKS
jgi:hypothetical protein